MLIKLEARMKSPQIGDNLLLMTDQQLFILAQPNNYLN